MKAVGTSDVKDGIHRLTCVICPMVCAVEVQMRGGKVRYGDVSAQGGESGQYRRSWSREGLS